ncbi:MAG: ROK family protein [Bacteroidota bacterium]
MPEQLSLGVDIGGTNTVFGLVDIQGKILYKDKLSTRAYSKPAELVDAISINIKANMPAGYSLKGIGIGAPNGNYYTSCIEFAPNLPWEGTIPMAYLFSSVLNAPAILTNDANAAAMGEMIYGAAQGMRDFIVITLGTGLGSGIVVNGQVLYGNDGNAGELGHVIVFDEGRDCGCGRKGCLEAYASATGITRTVVELLSLSTSTSSLSKTPVAELNSKIIYDAALLGDTIALEAFDYTAKILGKALANAVAFSCPEAIILFGGLAHAKEFILEPSRLYMEEYMLGIYKNKVKLLASNLPESDAALLGASALAWNEA